MNQTVVGVFNTYQAAQGAAAELAREGFDRDDVQVKSTGSSDSSTSGTSASASRDNAGEDTGVMASIRHFFADLFGDDDNAGTYTEAVRRGGAVVTVDADEDRLDRAREVLTRCGAVDIEEQVSQWRSQGWTGDDEDGIGSARPQGAAGMQTQGGTVSGQDRVSGRSEGSTEQNVLPVVEEELQVGKRQVRGGVVRVVSRVSSRPVTESVDLRREEAVIERRNVDRPATEADMAAFQERTIEIEETEEQAVVSKSAHVVEEVVVGKQVHHQTEQVEDSVRRTEVEVERGGAGSGRGSSGTGGRAAGTMSSVGSSGSLGGATVTGASGSARRSFADYEDDFRQDWQTNHASSGGRYEDFQPAYRSGYEMRGDSQFSGRQWDDAEPHLRQRWESDNPGSTWEHVKSAVRRGWDRATS